MTFTRYLLAVALSGTITGTHAASMRCDKGLIATGDITLEVMEKCGEPAGRQIVHSARDEAGYIREGAATVEYWSYGPIYGMTYQLRFVDGRLVQIRSRR